MVHSRKPSFEWPAAVVLAPYPTLSTIPGSLPAHDRSPQSYQDCFFVFDNKNTVLSLEYSLEWENLGIELAGTAYDGRSGKELIEKTDPDIIISDINMPYLDGFTMVEESGKAEDRIIIVITGYDKFQYASRAIKLAVF